MRQKPGVVIEDLMQRLNEMIDQLADGIELRSESIEGMLRECEWELSCRYYDGKYDHMEAQ